MQEGIRRLAAVDPAWQAVDASLLTTADSERDRGRWQDAVIIDQIASGARVLDLGCGEGDLLVEMAAKGIAGQGIEFDQDAIARCIDRGAHVLQANLDEGLAWFSDNSFDMVILEETLQTLSKPLSVLAEMLRVGRRCLVSFPNFGFWRTRLDLLISGRMPVTSHLPHRWYDTPNIHLLTLGDFTDWAAQHHVAIQRGWVHDGTQVRSLGPDDNLLAAEVLLELEGEQHGAA